MLPLFADPAFLQVAIPAGVGAVAASGGGAAIYARAKTKREEKKERERAAAEDWADKFYGWREWLQSVVNGTSGETPLAKAQGIRNLFETAQPGLPGHAVSRRYDNLMFLTYYPVLMADHYVKMAPVGSKASPVEGTLVNGLPWTRSHWDMVISYLEVIPEDSPVVDVFDTYLIANAAQLLLNYRFSPTEATEQTTFWVDQAVKRQRDLRKLWRHARFEATPWEEASKKPKLASIEHASSLNLDRNAERSQESEDLKLASVPPQRRHTSPSKGAVEVKVPKGEFNDEEHKVVTRFMESAGELPEEKVVSGNSLLQKLAAAANAEEEAEAFNEPTRSQVIGLASKNRQTAMNGLLALLGDDMNPREAEVLKALRVDEKYLDAKTSQD